MHLETIEQIKAHAIPSVGPTNSLPTNAYVVQKVTGGPYKAVEGTLCYQSRVVSQDEEKRKRMAEFVFYPKNMEEFDPVFRKIAFPGIRNIAKTRDYGGMDVDPNKYPNTILYLSDKALFTDRTEAEEYCNLLNNNNNNGVSEES